jgi:hypothetical protein
MLGFMARCLLIALLIAATPVVLWLAYRASAWVLAGLLVIGFVIWFRLIARG